MISFAPKASWLFSAALLLLAATACSDSGAAPKTGGGIAVTVMTAAAAPMAHRVTATGTIEPSATVVVRTQVDGQLKAVLFKEGDAVTAGQALFQIDDSTIRAQVAAATATRDRDAATAKQLQAELERIRTLTQKGYESKSALDQAQAAADAAAEAVRADEAQIGVLTTQLAHYAIAAPIAGRTGETTLQPGATVSTGDANGLVTIDSIKPVRVRFSIPAGDIADTRAHFAAGDATVTAVIHGGAGASASGKLVFLDNAVDAGNGQLLAKGEFANADEALVPGALVDVTLDLGVAANLVALPESAVQLSGDKPFVFIAAEGDVAARRAVEIAGRLDGRIFLKSGVNPGERVVVDGLVKLTDGAKLEIKDTPPEPAKAGGAS